MNEISGSVGAHDGFGRRMHPRAEVRSGVLLSASEWTWQGEIQNISLGGAFVATDMPSPTLGLGVRLDFRLPVGANLSLCASVKWIRADESAEGPRGFGVQFVGTGRTEEKVLAGYVAGARGRGDTSDTFHAKIAERFMVETEGETIWIRMCGVLRSEESKELLVQIKQQMAQTGPGKLLTYIDAKELGPCSDESLAYVKEWFSACLEHEPFYAVAVIRNAITTLQLRRLAREVGIANSMACFDDEADAMPFWKEIRSECL